MTIPWRKRFRIDFDHNSWRFSLRVLVGFVVFYVSRKWESWNTESTLISEIAIGWIPWNIQAGQTVRAWKPYHHEEYLKQQVHRRPRSGAEGGREWQLN